MDTIPVQLVICIGMLVVLFLLNTFRFLKAIEICKECLFLLNHKEPRKEERIVKLFYKKVYSIMSIAYRLVHDYASAITYGEKALHIHRECGDRTDSEVIDILLTLGTLYQHQTKYQESKERYEEANDILRETGDIYRELHVCINLGELCVQYFGKFVEAKTYFEKALAISKQEGYRKEEGLSYQSLGIVYKSIGDMDKMEACFQKALVIAKEIGDRKLECSSYLNLGCVCRHLGKYIEAKKHLRDGLAITVETGDIRNEASAYANLGTVLEVFGKYDEAKKHQEKALAIYEKLGDSNGKIFCYGNLGTLFLSLGEYGKAKEHLDKALTFSKQIGDRKEEAMLYFNLGTVFDFLADYVKAEEYQKKALEIMMEFGDVRIGAPLYGLGCVYLSLSNYPKAKEYLEKALENCRQLGDRKNESSCYLRLGNLFQFLGAHAKAKEFIEKAIAIRIEIGDKLGEASAYNDLGAVLHMLGDVMKAKKCYVKAMVTNVQIGNRNGELTTYGNLATLFTSLGEYEKATNYIKKSITITKEIGHRQKEGWAYGNLGRVFTSLGEYVKAKEYHEKALAVSKEIGDIRGEAGSYVNLGCVSVSLGEYWMTIEYQEKALIIAKEIGDRSLEATSLGTLGVAFQYLGEYAKAKEYHEKAHGIAKETGDLSGEATTCGNLGFVYLSLGNYLRAEELYKKALAISKEIQNVELQLDLHCSLALVQCFEGKLEEGLSNLFESVQRCEDLRRFIENNDEFRIFLLDKHVLPYLALSAYFCVAGNPLIALRIIELGRARALVDLMTAQYLGEKIPINSQLLVGIESIMKKTKNFCCLYISYTGKYIFFWILKKTGVVFRQVTVDECVNTGILGSFDDFFGKIRTFCLLSPEQCEDRSLCPVNEKQLTAKLSLETLVGNVASLRLVEEDEEINQEPEPSLALIYKLIIAPVADLLDQSEITIAPDRSLYNVPFAALQNESGRYLSETFRIRIIPSLTTLKLIQDSPADYHSKTGALIVGDPAVGHVIYKGRHEWVSPLPFARKEAEMIARLLNVQALVGKHPTKQAVLQRINSVSLIHFACHGNAERGEIALASLDPTNGNPQEQDYLLTMSDISQVQLRAKLVVLSCCHSARGEVRVEGVVGIARAFLGSGARSVLMALWAIQDEATEQFMSHFYEHLVRGKSASESLFKTMKWMRGNGFTDVSQWAPFLLIGDDVKFSFVK